MRSLTFVSIIFCVILSAVPAFGQDKAKSPDKAEKADAKSPENANTCVYCGEPATCRICRTVPEKKKVSKTVFSCEDEDFCIPGRSQCQTTTEIDENGCAQQRVHTIPTAKEIRSRRVLKKSTEEKEEMTYKLVAQKVCAACACNLPPLPADGDKDEKSKSEDSGIDKSKTEDKDKAKDKAKEKTEPAEKAKDRGKSKL